MWKKQYGDSEVLIWKYGTVVLSEINFKLSQFIKNNNTFIISIPELEHNFQSQYQKSQIITIECSEDESLKAWETVDKLCNKMMQKRLNRQSTVYIIGGGMLLDLAGFACSIYMRGIKKVIYIPTTLLAIVDATVGGKTGINWGAGKNLLGVTKHPDQILISLSYLETLNARQFCNGIAQVIKMSMTHDSELFEKLKGLDQQKIRCNKNLLKEIIKRSLEIKINLVENDQFDRSSRKWLNFGHTVGHALELYPFQNKLKHGQCVSMGIIKQLQIGYFYNQVKDYQLIVQAKKIFAAYNLPTDIPKQVNSTFIVQQMMKDKKNSKEDCVQLTLIESVGNKKIETTQISQKQLQNYFNKSVSISGINIDKKTAEDAIARWDEQFPSSKSLSIRYLYIAALYYYLTKRSIVVKNFLNSDDTQCLKISLNALGFTLEQNLRQKTIRISGYKSQKVYGILNVGNSGLTARFILPLCAFIKGQWKIVCHPRMAERPNWQIINYCLENYNCSIIYQGKPMSFPLSVKSDGKMKKIEISEKIRKIFINSTKSSQFISSIIINSLLLYNTNQGVVIETNSGILVSQSYLEMTIFCLKKFGMNIQFLRNKNTNKIVVDKYCQTNVIPKNYSQVIVEKDLSSLTYPYAFSLLLGFELPKLPEQTCQGDIQFYQYCKKLRKMGQLPLDQQKLAGPIVLDFNLCTDSFMTMTILLASGIFKLNRQVKIVGISNQRIKQSNRIKLMRENLQRIGYMIEEFQDGLIFPPQSLLEISFNQKNVDIFFQTGDDHRIAMSMAIMSCWLSSKYPFMNFIIDDKWAVKKTFPKFWKFLQDCGIILSHKCSDKQVESGKYNINIFKHKKLIVIGNRGSGKSTLSQVLANKKNMIHIDLDHIITEHIQREASNPNYSIAEYVEKHSWDCFRRLQSETLQNILSSHCLAKKDIIISAGGGIIEGQQSKDNLNLLKLTMPIVYIERQFDELRISHNAARPRLQNFEDRSKIRQKQYEEICNYIITMPKLSQEIQSKFFVSEVQRILFDKTLQEISNGKILCLAKMHNIQSSDNGFPSRQFQILKLQERQVQDLVCLEIRIDYLMNYFEGNQKKIRKYLAQFKVRNNDLIDKLPTILTLRSLRQYGVFNGVYNQVMKNLCKIPSNFIDIESAQNLPGYFVNHNKLLYSYHGNDNFQINKLLERSLGNKKLCYFGKGNSSIHNIWDHKMDICYNLNNPLSRLKNKFQMSILDRDRSGIINIPSLSQLKLLSKMTHTFCKMKK